VAVQPGRRRNTGAVAKTTAAFHRRRSCRQAKAETSDAAASPELPRIADGKKNATGNYGAFWCAFSIEEDIFSSAAVHVLQSCAATSAFR
jgi:hypothetical protein